ncbi:MAG TPA: sensor histidine kinase [Gaiellaceae bacterium]
MRRLWPLLRAYSLDALIVLAALEGVLEVLIRKDLEAPRTTLWFVVPASVAIVLPLLWRRRFPFGMPALVWILGAAVSFVDGRLVVFTSSIYVAGMVAAFQLGNLADGARARLGLLVVVGSAAVILSNDPTHTTDELIFTPLFFALGWLAGYALRERSERADAAEVRAAQAERERDAAMRVAVAEERARIARELHDIVAHAVSVMVLQVGAVRHKLPESLEEPSDALKGVEQTGRSALAEMRRLLTAMRRDGDARELAPQPGLGSLESLLEEVGRAGLPVQLHLDGEPFAVPRAIDLSAYRIVQEGLTNALKHARASRADVTVRYRPDELQVEVRDDGAGDGTGGSPGYGLVGVRERVKIYGGKMSAGRAAGGGFVLETRLPLGGDGP